MLRATTDLLVSPTPLLRGQPPDPLTAIVSGTAGTWHPGHALYCLWRSAQRRWPHTRAWSARWRFYLNGRQEVEAMPERTAETLIAPNLCPVFAIHLIPALALGEQLQPAIRPEMEAQAAHAALVHEIFSALRSALVRRMGNHPGALSRSRSQDLQRRRAPAHARHESRTSHAQEKRQHGGHGIASSCRRTGRWTSHQQLWSQPRTTTTPDEPTSPKKTPS